MDELAVDVKVILDLGFVLIGNPGLYIALG